MQEFNIFTKSVQDFFTKEMIKLALYPFAITIILFYALFFTAADFGLDALQNSSIQIQQSQSQIINGVEEQTTINETYEGGNAIIEFLLKNSITSWLIGFVIYTVGGIAVMMLSVFIAIFIIGFLTPNILSILIKRHYPQIELNNETNYFQMIITPIKHTLAMLALFVLFIPLYFIPIINIIAFNLPFYYFFHKLLNFDITSTIKMQPREYYQIKATQSNQIRLRTLLLYFMSMIPFIALFAAVFFIIYLGRGYMQSLIELREKEIKQQESN